MIRYTAPFFLGTVAGCAAFLFWTSQSVQQAQDRLADVKAGLAQEKQSLRVLRAEWDYLSRPDRLEALARQYLDLSPPTQEGLIASLDALRPLPPEEPPAPAEKIGARTGAAARTGEALIPRPPAARGPARTPQPETAAGPPPVPESGLEPESAEEGAVFSSEKPVPPSRARRSFDAVLARAQTQGGRP